MRIPVSILFCLWFFYASAQDYAQVKKRFDSCLTFHGSLNQRVQITPEKLSLYNSNKQLVFCLVFSDWAKMALALKKYTDDTLSKIIQDPELLKKLRIQTPVEKKKKYPEIKIMIDPGHMAGNLQMAHTEQKFLHFTKAYYPALQQDSIDIAEGILTFQTAWLLKNMLEEKGMQVALSRKEHTSTFGLSYDDWYEKCKKKVLDSLWNNQKINTARYHQLLNENKARFFTDFFKEYELQQRARVINNYHPDLTVIIHYNVDEKNTDWKKPGSKDFCMAFIPGCLSVDNISTVQGQINLLRLLLCNDLNESENISALLLHQLSSKLQIPIAQTTDASYLSEHCLATSSKGVYSRNLALCRMVQSPLVYGECLYQDNEKECFALTQNTVRMYGIQTNKRVLLAAQSFYEAILSYYGEK